MTAILNSDADRAFDELRRIRAVLGVTGDTPTLAAVLALRDSREEWRKNFNGAMDESIAARGRVGALERQRARLLAALRDATEEVKRELGSASDYERVIREIEVLP